MTSKGCPGPPIEPVGPSRHSCKLDTYLINIDEVTDTELWRLQLSLEREALQQAERLVTLVESKLDSLAKADERVRRFRTVPGEGPRLAELVVAVIDDPHRFRNAKQLGAYAGLCASQLKTAHLATLYESGTISRQVRITCPGNALLRGILVEVGWMMRRYSSWFSVILDRVCRGAKTRRKIAVVAVARRLLICCWAMLRDEQDWRSPVPT